MRRLDLSICSVEPRSSKKRSETSSHCQRKIFKSKLIIILILFFLILVSLHPEGKVFYLRPVTTAHRGFISP